MYLKCGRGTFRDMMREERESRDGAMDHGGARRVALSDLNALDFVRRHTPQALNHSYDTRAFIFYTRLQL